MKHLKTYEVSTDLPKLSVFNNKWNDKFIKWFKENGLEKVELPEPDSINSINQIMDEDEYYYIVNVFHEKFFKKDEIWITAEWKKDNHEGIDSWHAGFWDEDTLKQIWNYLQKLTPEEIENIRANQEAEKFNF